MELYGQNHPKTVSTENELALCLKDFKKYDEALDVLHKTRKKNVYSKQEQHSTIAKTYHNLGIIYYEKG